MKVAPRAIMRGRAAAIPTPVLVAGGTGESTLSAAHLRCPVS
jgi:hypothetical protein